MLIPSRLFDSLDCINFEHKSFQNLQSVVLQDCSSNEKGQTTALQGVMFNIREMNLERGQYCKMLCHLHLGSSDFKHRGSLYYYVHHLYSVTFSFTLEH